MDMYVVSIYDAGTAAFSRPAFVRAKGEAIRSFQEEVNRDATNDNPNALNKHPQDFALYFLGLFNDHDGTFSCPNMPEKLVDAAAVKSSPE